MRIRAASSLLCAFALAVACAPPADKPAEKPTDAAAAEPAADAAKGTETVEDVAVVATYSGKKLTSADVLAEIDRLPGPSRAYLSAPDRKRQFVENIILNDLLFEEGKKQGYDKDPDIDRQIVDMRKRLVVQKLMRELQKPPEITDEQAKQYYDDNPSLYSTTQIKASHILVKDEETAKEIYAELEKEPSKFAEIAKEKSTDRTSGGRGGDLGKFAQGRMVPEFEKVAFSLEPNKLSEPVKTQYGWHIIIVTEREEGERKPFDQVKEQIRATMRNKALQDAMQTRFDDLKKGASLTIDETVLEGITPPPVTAGAPGAMSPHGGGH
ncbi:MAG: peptidylprolyl isomerase [bacterium]|nr:peptidylprolyl isomerase [bacterium]